MNSKIVSKQKHCCEDMENNTYCVEHELDKKCVEEKSIYYVSKYDEYGIPVRDGEEGSSMSYIEIKYCPWCGKKLNGSKREEWFTILEELGYDEPLEQDIPIQFETSKWYEKQE